MCAQSRCMQPSQPIWPTLSHAMIEIAIIQKKPQHLYLGSSKRPDSVWTHQEVTDLPELQKGARFVQPRHAVQHVTSAAGQRTEVSQCGH